MPNSMSASTYFSRIPKTLDVRRSSFPLSTDVTTTFDAGKLIPFMSFFEILPGDTWSVDLSYAVRMATPIHPTFGDAFLDVYWFFCPNRILWDHWREFIGENRSGPWAPDVKYTVPQHTFPKFKDASSKGFTVHSVADYLGLPLALDENETMPTVSSLPFRAYERIWSEWFRSTAVQNPAMLYTGDAATEGQPGGDYWISAENTAAGGSPFPVNRLHDYFSSALPQPQYGDALTLQAGELIGSGPFLLGTNGQHFSFTQTGTDLKWTTTASALPGSQNKAMVYDSGLSINWTTTVNDLRIFFQTQKFQEKMAFGGNRYRDIIHSLFGVFPPDASIQIPEYLGGSRVKLGMQQVLQTSSTDSTSPQGNTAAFSFTANNSHQFTKSFQEHGILMAVCCVRNQSIYSQGIARKWSRTDFLDYYNPVFANIGNQPIKNKELFCSYNSAGTDDEVFGYQEAWAEYRYHPNFTSGKMRPELGSDSLSSWNYAESYDQPPTLSDAWMRSPAESIMDRTIAVPSEPQFIGEFLATGTVSRVMPVYSVPGLLDHH